MPLSDELERAEGYADIFALLKKAVKRSLGEHRVGLMLYLGNLPLKVGAFHPMGTNDIVLNRRLIKAAKSEPRRKAYIFSVLLHEYLHSLGYVQERHVRGLTYKVCLENFGSEHPVTEAAVTGPWVDLRLEDFEEMAEGLDLELVRDFERIDSGYII
ncbi:MAG: hypothetical protein ACE5OO_03120 [Candidatus Bathyarchaeia archaeon]